MKAWRGAARQIHVGILTGQPHRGVADAWKLVLSRIS
jgi:hypothetical protein